MDSDNAIFMIVGVVIGAVLGFALSYVLLGNKNEQKPIILTYDNRGNLTGIIPAPTQA